MKFQRQGLFFKQELTKTPFLKELEFISSLKSEGLVFEIEEKLNSVVDLKVESFWNGVFNNLIDFNFLSKANVLLLSEKSFQDELFEVIIRYKEPYKNPFDVLSTKKIIDNIFCVLTAIEATFQKYKKISEGAIVSLKDVEGGYVSEQQKENSFKELKKRFIQINKVKDLLNRLCIYLKLYIWFGFYALPLGKRKEFVNAYLLLILREFEELSKKQENRSYLLDLTEQQEKDDMKKDYNDLSSYTSSSSKNEKNYSNLNFESTRFDVREFKFRNFKSSLILFLENELIEAVENTSNKSVVEELEHFSELLSSNKDAFVAQFGEEVFLHKMTMLDNQIKKIEELTLNQEKSKSSLKSKFSKNCIENHLAIEALQRIVGLKEDALLSLFSNDFYESEKLKLFSLLITRLEQSAILEFIRKIKDKDLREINSTFISNILLNKRKEHLKEVNAILSRDEVIQVRKMLLYCLLNARINKRNVSLENENSSFGDLKIKSQEIFDSLSSTEIERALSYFSSTSGMLNEKEKERTFENLRYWIIDEDNKGWDFLEQELNNRITFLENVSKNQQYVVD